MKKLSLISLLTLSYLSVLPPTFATTNPTESGEAKAFSSPFGKDPVFKIKPYLYSQQGKAFVLAWRYQRPENMKTVAVQLFKNGKAWQMLEPTRLNEIDRVILPENWCAVSALTYQVSGMSAPQKINAVPCAQQNENFLFSFITDTQEFPMRAQKFANLIARTPSQFILHGGDLVQNGDKDPEWVDFFGALSNAIQQRVLIPSVGNHEYRFNSRIPAWSKYFSFEAFEGYYSVKLGNMLVIILNSCFEDDPTLYQRQLTWLQKKLASQPATWRVVVHHHPPFSKSIFHLPYAPQKEHLLLQKSYVPLYEQYKVDLVLNGHTHLTERARQNGVEYLVGGAAGGLMGIKLASDPQVQSSESIFSISHFSVSPQKMEVLTEDIEGRTIDQWSIQKK